MAVMRNNLEMYDRQADQWWQPGGIFEPLKGFNPARFQYFDCFVSDWSGLRVLDVGCGGGYTCEFLARRGASVWGVDRSRPSIEAARAHAAEQGLAIAYDLGVGEQLPYGAAAFDAVVCVDVLEHVDDVGQVIGEIHRVLRSGGLFLFDTINRTLWSRVLMIWVLENVLGEIPKGTHDWNLFIKPEELRSHLSDKGFAAIDMRGLDVKGKDKNGYPKAVINGNLSALYIGKAAKP